MTGNDDSSELDTLKRILESLQVLEPAARARILQTALTFFGIDTGASAPRSTSQSSSTAVPTERTVAPYSEDLGPTPKQFFLQKQPRTDVERIACLAYYLTHYRNIPFFKTIDLTKLNTDAAQPKFSNAAYSSDNALKMGYLAPATKGQRQLSAAGEQFVQLLPDRDAARATMTGARPRRRVRLKKRFGPLDEGSTSGSRE
jgi:hypothetical protein